jgi:hypothetical protein
MAVSDDRCGRRGTGGALCIVDGELIACDANGLADFQLLQWRKPDDPAIYCAFDLIEIDGRDLCNESIETRKAELARLLTDCQPLALASTASLTIRPRSCSIMPVPPTASGPRIPVTSCHSRLGYLIRGILAPSPLLVKPSTLSATIAGVGHKRLANAAPRTFGAGAIIVAAPSRSRRRGRVRRRARCTESHTETCRPSGASGH